MRLQVESVRIMQRSNGDATSNTLLTSCLFKHPVASSAAEHIGAEPSPRSPVPRFVTCITPIHGRRSQGQEPLMKSLRLAWVVGQHGVSKEVIERWPKSRPDAPFPVR